MREGSHRWGRKRPPDPPLLALADVERAAARIAGRVHRTPVVTSRLLDRELGCQVVAKAEHLQRVGAFKARGAFNALLALDPDRRAAGVLAVTSGNHGQAVALAAAETGGRAVVVMPAGSNPAKVAATRAYGAEVVTAGVTGENRESFAAELAADRGLHLVHPFDDHDVMAGQGTAALELLADAPDLDLVLVPVGGGGLIAGTAAAVKGRSPATRVVGVEPAAAADAQASLRAGRRIPLPAAPATIADGVRSLCVGERPFEVIRSTGRRHRHRHRRRAARGPRAVLVADQAAGRADRRPAPGRPAHRRRPPAGGSAWSSPAATSTPPPWPPAWPPRTTVACPAWSDPRRRARPTRRPGGRAGSSGPTWPPSWSAGWRGWRPGRSPAGGCSPTPARPGSRGSRR